MFQSYYRWWVGELAGLLAAKSRIGEKWKGLVLDGDESVEVLTQSKGAALSHGHLKVDTLDRDPSTAKKLGAALKGKETLIRLSSDDVLDRTIQIPRGASDVIEPILTNQLERMVPWVPSETAFGYEILGQNSDNPSKLDVRVIATTIAVLERAKAHVAALGVEPIAIDYQQAIELESGVILASLDQKSMERARGLVHRGIVGAVIVSFVTGCLGLFLLSQRQSELATLNDQVEQFRSRLSDVDAARQLDADEQKQRTVLIEKRKALASAMVIVEALSRSLPDDSYLTDLKIEGQEVTFSGNSTDPTALIAAIESAPQFQNVRFVSATTKSENENTDRFSITADARPAPLKPLSSDSKTGKTEGAK